MQTAVYEFPLNEKVRNYLRVEQLFVRLQQGEQAQQGWQYISFFEAMFTLLDLLERLDIRNDILKDIDSHEKNLVQWSQHPQIDTEALQSALQRIIRLRERIKQAKKLGSELKDDRFLASIRQRFSIPGGTCSFDLPNLHYWFNQRSEIVQNNIQGWLSELSLVKESIQVALSFLRERGRFTQVTAQKGFYQGVADDRIELIRIISENNSGFYPVLSGNKYRYAIRFMWFDAEPGKPPAVEQDVSFEMASC
ncbi:cell division protein ZapD [Aestuariibacter salexigens]|uniref:cell division protein ZapD n=1 Tax=Aestuariibacter salexigens TaxID=226010 RepID=UPI00047C0663|nr:cell division protein ZapD [Aestuariibacter salexigens]